MIDFPKKYNSPTQIITHSNFLNDQEINNILDNINLISYEKGETLTNISNYRTSNIKWLPFESNFKDIYLKTTELIHNYNSQFWRFKLTSAQEEFQYTEYHGNNQGKYNWHSDIGNGVTSTRKISATIQLSDPSEYEGGDLQIFSTLKGGENFPFLNAEKNRGTIVLFPSFTPHRVTPVTKGIRKSLVLWVGGCAFK